MNNSFTTVPPLLKRRELGIGGCGTTHTFREAFRLEGDGVEWNIVTGGYSANDRLLALRWEDRKSVRMLSTIHRLEQRIDKLRKKPRPTGTRGRVIPQAFGDCQA
jgi:hypothetical protein